MLRFSDMGEPKLKIIRTREDHRRALENSEEKFELVNGQYRMMAGSRQFHNDIITNIKGYTFEKIRKGGCRINSESLNIQPSFSGDSFIPDIVIHCPDDPGLNAFVVENPLALFEVTSEGGEAYDRVFKFEVYRRIPSLRHYVVISQTEMRVAHHFRPDAATNWADETFTRPEDRLVFTEVPFDLSLAQIYADLPLG